MDPAEAPAHGPRIATVLVAPQGPRNVGAVARALLNFGLTELRLVGGVDPLDPAAREAAVNALPLLEAARRTESLGEAIADATFVVGTTARRRARREVLGARAAAPRILEEAARGRVALLFGQEDHGLGADALAACHAVISIPTDPRCRALNLAQSVLLIAYEIFTAAGNPGRDAGTDPGPVIESGTRTRLEALLEEALRHLGILTPSSEIACHGSLARILSLGPMQTRDARLLFTLARRILAMPAWSEAWPDGAPHRPWDLRPRDPAPGPP
jgi:TrmH family RNA methyltransferase